MKRKTFSWTSTLKQIFSPVRKKLQKRASSRTQLKAEQLDDRIVPASYTITDGGDTAASQVTITQLP